MFSWAALLILARLLSKSDYGTGEMAGFLFALTNTLAEFGVGTAALHMKELEDALGFSLFNRSTHGIMLTDAGEGLLQNSLQMLAKLDDYVVEARNLQKGPYGTLRIQSAGDYARDVLAPLLSKFMRLRPGLRVHLLVAPDSSEWVFRQVRKTNLILGPEYKHTIIWYIVRDEGSASHPTGGLAAAPLLAAASVLHPTPRSHSYCLESLSPPVRLNR